MNEMETWVDTQTWDWTKKGRRDVWSELLTHPEFKSMGRKKLTGVEEGAWSRDKEVEIKNPMVITRIPDLFQSPISQVEGEGGQRKGRLGDDV